MKAIYAPKPILCVVADDDGDGVPLEPMDGTEDQRFWVYFDDPCLIIDPTDDEVLECQS